MWSLILTVVVWLLHAEVRAWTCVPFNLYVDPTANTTVGRENNGTSADTAFSNVYDAASRLRDILRTPLNVSDSYPQVFVNLAPTVHPLSTYLTLTGLHSGNPECPVIWRGNGGEATLSGGVKLSNWTASANMSGVWTSPAPAGAVTRAFYVDGKSMPRARSFSINKNESDYSLVGWRYNGSSLDLSSVSKIHYTDLRAIGTWTDRYTPAQSLEDDGTLRLKQPAWYRQQLGYDVYTLQTGLGFSAGALELYLENSLSFLDDEGEWYHDVDTETVYYKPIGGKDPSTSEIYFPLQEVLLSIGGFNYDLVAHDMTFENVSFAHTTWNFPSSNYGYVEQQTGAYIGEQFNRTAFEEYRNHWYMTPGTVQISAAERITIQDGTVSCTGAAGITVGGNAEANVIGVGLGAKNITIQDMTFTQTGGNALQVGGVQEDAHHPALTQQINSGILISHNLFSDNGKIFTSSSNLLMTYTQYSSIEYNTIEHTPYSAISYGWGWGTVDEGFSPDYFIRTSGFYNSWGIYDWMPMYTTPTTNHDNRIFHNYIADVGLNHTDEGGIYTLSQAPNTFIQGNVVNGSRQLGLYFDEGSRNYSASGNVINATRWLGENYNVNDNDLTGYQTVFDNWSTKNISDEKYTLDQGLTPQGDMIYNNHYFDPNASLPDEVVAIVSQAGVDAGR